MKLFVTDTKPIYKIIDYKHHHVYGFTITTLFPFDIVKDPSKQGEQRTATK